MQKPTRATIYINELDILTEVVPKREFQAGERVGKEDIAGITELKFANVTIPEDNAIIFYFCVGWRRGIFFDFRPNYSDVKLVVSPVRS
jgi:hypothetical protein